MIEAKSTDTKSYQGVERKGSQVDFRTLRCHWGSVGESVQITRLYPPEVSSSYVGPLPDSCVGTNKLHYL